MAALPIISTIAGIAGTFITAQGTLAAGKAAKQASDYEAAQLDIKAKEEQAAAQREAQDLGRKRDLALSTLQARSAASGFEATDPSTLAAAEEISKYGTLQEQMAMYGGTSRRAGLEAQASGRRMEGSAAAAGARYSAAGTILGGMSSMATRWGQNYNSGGGGSYRYG